MKPVFLCNPKKNKRCTAHKTPGVTTCNECHCTTKFWCADWKRMFKFWWNKWFGKNETFRCRHLCCLCEFKPEYYIDCMFDISGQDNTRRLVISRGSGKTYWPAYIVRQLYDFFASRKRTMYKEEMHNNEGTTKD